MKMIQNMTDDEIDFTKQAIALTEILRVLNSEETELSYSLLGELSDLSAEEIKIFDNVWSALTTERKCEILSRLDELAKNNVELNFDRIYRNAIYSVDDSVRRMAVEGLWESTDASLLPPLLRLAKQDPSDEVRSAVATALGKFAVFAEHQQTTEENRHKLAQTLLGIIQDSSEALEVRRRALEAVSPLSISAVTQAIREAYHSGEQAMRISSVFAMGRNCDQLWTPIVLKEMENEEPAMRYEAATAAGEMGEMAAVPKLLSLTEDADTEVKLAAISALGKIGGKEAKQKLLSLLTDKSSTVHDVTEQALAEIGAYEVPDSQHMHDYHEPDAN
ncbi:MAG: HEAT repeat domain-containing protein [Dehalococcoidia bacterium]|nr:HEAT repeat domain-containing protein [Dehalococcoidia bacterium]